MHVLIVLQHRSQTDSGALSPVDRAHVYYIKFLHLDCYTQAICITNSHAVIFFFITLFQRNLILRTLLTLFFSPHNELELFFEVPWHFVI